MPKSRHNEQVLYSDIPLEQWTGRSQQDDPGWIEEKTGRCQGNWAEELPNVLWAYRTTPCRSTGETPFSLTYEAEAVIPVEVNLCSARVDGFNPAYNEQMMLEQLDSLEEYREATTIRLAEYQQKLARRYNQDVRVREFGARDLVLRKAMGNM